MYRSYSTCGEEGGRYRASVRCIQSATITDPALFQMNTGFIQAGYPSMGSWITYRLGTENQNLPAFVVFSNWRGGPIAGTPN